MWEIQVQSVGCDDPLEKRMATLALLPGEFHEQRQTTVHGVVKSRT